MGTSRTVGVGLGLLAALLAAGAVAPTSLADEATYQNLMERSLELLKDAERADREGNRERAAGRAREALTLLENADALKPRDLDAPFLGVQGGVLAKDPRAVATWMQRFRERNPYGDRNPDVHYLEGFVALWLDGQPEVALRSFDRMIAVNPNARASERDLLYYAALGLAAEHRVAVEEYGAALRMYQAAARLAQRRGEVRKELASLGNAALVMHLDRQYLEAAAVFQELSKREPDNPFWHWRHGLTHATRQLWATAMPHYHATIRLLEAGKGAPAQLPELREVYLRLGNCHRNLAMIADGEERDRHVQEAISNLKRYVELVPNDSRGHYWLGTFYYDLLDRPYEAIPPFRRAHELDPVCDASLRNLVQIYSRYGPPEGDAATPEVRAAWAAELAALEKDLRENADARTEERKRRELGPTKDNHCE